MKEKFIDGEGKYQEREMQLAIPLQPKQSEDELWNRIIEAFDDIDFKLIILEDHLHDEDSETVTAIRGQLSKIIKLIPNYSIQKK